MMNETITINKYGEYKDSGIEWIGQIPKHWNFIKVKKIISVNNKSSIKAGDGKEKGKYPFFTSSQLLTKYLDDYNINGEYIIMGTGGSASVHYYNGKFNTSTDCLSYSISKLNQKFYYYYILNIIKVIDTLGFWGTGLRHLQRNFLLEHKIFFPLLEEQEQIVNYLDNKTKIIDKVIENTQIQINQLKEYEKSLINKVVTKGLNKNVELKDSSIEWIGNIPKHWEEIKLKYMGKMINGYAFNSSDFISSGIKVIKINNIQTFNFNWEDTSFLPNEFKEKYSNFLIHKDDLLFALTRPIISTGIKVTFYNDDEPALLNQRNAVFKVKTGLNKFFLYYTIYSNFFFHSFINKLKITNQPNIGAVDIQDIKILLPPLEEQEEIAKYLDIKTNKIQILIKNKQKQLNLFQELRKTIINDAVTGKVKIF